jgi:two-component system chemotaxis sensor kinase CheA
VSLLELVRLEGGEAGKGIESFEGAPVYRLRGNLLPIVYLAGQLELDEAGAKSTDTINIVVLQAGDRRFGLVVDGILDTEEIVVKPLSKQLKGISLFAGATIMGDGRVALILDVLGLAQQSGVVSERHDQGMGDHASQGGGGENLETLLLLGMGPHGRMGIRLSQVARLEEIPASSVEVADGREVVQYREQILPLLRLADHLGGGGDPPGENLRVVVYSEAGKSVGLVVDRILDIVETSFTLKRGSGRTGVLGSAVIQKRVTDLLDIHGLIASVMPDYFEEPVLV